jgi:hypothetical protein
MSTAYYICNEPSSHARRLDGNNQFYTGTCSGLGKQDTLVYKSKSAALKRLNTKNPFKCICTRLHPHACILVVEENICYFIDRDGKPVSIRS